MDGVCNSTFVLAPPPVALGRGQKVKYHKISITKSILKIFNPKFVYVCSQIKYIKHIKWNFHSVAWVMHAPGGWTLGNLSVR